MKATCAAHTRIPFDRTLAAQVIHEDLILLGNEVSLDNFGIRREW